MTQLIAGQNIVIPSDNAYSLALDLADWRWGVIATERSGASCFPENAEGLTVREDSLLLNLHDIGPDIEKLTVYIAVDADVASVKRVGMSASLNDLVGGQQYASIDITGQLDDQTAVNLLEIYRRNGAWKIRCVLQGFAEGLTKLLDLYGLADAAAIPPRQTLTSLQMTGQTEASIKLVWQSGKAKKRSVARYFMGENFNPISDLRVGCFYRLSNGQSGIVYSFEESLDGSFDGVPYIKASRSVNKHLEQLQINPLYFHKLDKYLVFVTMMEAYDSWEGLSVEVDIQLPSVACKKFSPSTLMVKPVYAVAMIDFSEEQATLTPLNEYFSDLGEMDHAFGWGLPWQHDNNGD